MNERVAEILESPRLPEIVEELRARLDEERQRRARFYAEVSKSVNAEFINGEIIMRSPAKVRHLKVRDRLLNLLLN